MDNYQKLMKKVLEEGEIRKTRSGKTRSLFGEHLEWDLRKGFPAMTTKRLAFKSCIGELLWFLNGETDLPSLRKRSCLPENAWTIWTNDFERWHKQMGTLDTPEYYDYQSLGNLYGDQWRNRISVDQIAELVYNIESDPTSRYHIVMNWSVDDVARRTMALAPCHVMFQVYVSGGFIDLIWYQRSVDTFLGLPFNIASYGALMHIIGTLTGKIPRYLKCSLGDVHIYEAHIPAVVEQLSREPKRLPLFDMPTIRTLTDLYELTADDFSLVCYEHHPAIKAPLKVGG